MFEALSSGDNTEPQSERLKGIAEDYLMGSANTLGTLSFYDHFNPSHAKKKVFVCNGTACLVSGTQGKLKSRLNEYFKDSEIGAMCCLGRCHENAAFHYKGRNYSGQDGNNFGRIFRDEIHLPKDRYEVRSTLDPPILTGNFDFGHYKNLFEAQLKKDPIDILQEIKQSHLKGRGGAAFYMGDKLETCHAQPTFPKFVVCNADEGDPGSYSDRYLIEEKPHAVLLGMLTAALVVGAEVAIIYIRAEYPESISAMEEAIKQWSDYSQTGGKNERLPIALKIVGGAGSYVCGEETALLSSIEGQRPEVRIRPPYPAESGLFLKPTLLNNVETFASIPYILQHGAQAFRQLGTEATPGVKLMSLDGYFNRPGIVEVEMGTPLHQVVYDLAGGFRKPVKAIQIGGPLGGIVPIDQIANLSIDFESFATQGFDLGHASVVCIPEHFPMIKYLEHLFEFAAHESCGKCFPCRLGTIRGKELMQQAQESVVKLELVKELLYTLRMGSLCGLGKALPIPVENALKYFSEELQSYFGD